MKYAKLANGQRFAGISILELYELLGNVIANCKELGCHEELHRPMVVRLPQSGMGGDDKFAPVIPYRGVEIKTSLGGADVVVIQGGFPLPWKKDENGST